MRSKYVDENGEPKYTNRLIEDSSPYLVQHGHNPVDWYPWCDEAFVQASAQDKPIFLSIGYSTCHWCHVMERESFDNEDIAGFLNEHFISIKLDREQRPDLDEIYMTGLQLMTGQGGWPLSSFVTPKGKPFFAGTYFPPEQFLSLLTQINEAWRTKREEITSQATQMSEAIDQQTRVAKQAQAVDDQTITQAIDQLLVSFDENHGGFGRAPKFPNESQLWLFANRIFCEQSASERRVVLHSLDQMSRGGFYDHIAGGFHRYSVDAEWQIPHFEKMLYNQAQLIRLYAAGFAISGARDYLRVLDETIAYVRREMTATDGSFYSATDADSEGEEGRFFVWSKQELRTSLTESEFSWVEDLYGVTEEGNFEGSNVLRLTESLEQFAVKQNQSVTAIEELLAGVQTKLLQQRNLRPRPFLDEKIIASWNALLIMSLVEVEQLTGQSEYRQMALDAAEALWLNHVQTKPFGLLRSRLKGKVSVNGTLEDFAFVAEAYWQLFLVSGGKKWRIRAEQLMTAMMECFWDSNEGGFFASQSETEGPMIVRSKSPRDAAIPSGNAAALSALVLAFEATGDTRYLAHSQQLIRAFSGRLADSPSAYPYFLTAVQRHLTGSRNCIQFAAGGVIRVVLARQSQTRAVLSLWIEEGWHINHPAASMDSDLLGLNIEGGELEVPDPEWIDAGFSSQSIAVLSGHIEIQIELTSDQVEVSLQACSDEICLAPQQLILRLPPIIS